MSNRSQEPVEQHAEVVAEASMVSVYDVFIGELGSLADCRLGFVLYMLQCKQAGPILFFRGPFHRFAARHCA